MYCVYKIIHKRTKKFYVGSTANIEKRLYHHLNLLDKGEHHCKPLQDLYKSRSDFKVRTFECRSRKAAYQKEQRIINRDDPKMLNVGMGVFGGDNLTRNPNKGDIISRISESLKAKNSSMTKEERSELHGQFGSDNGMYGNTHSKSSRKKMSRTRKKNLRKMSKSERSKKFVISDSCRDAATEANKKRVGDKNHFYGKHHTDETKRKLSEANKGQLPPNTLKVIAEGQEFESMSDAARTLGCATATVRNRCNSDKFPNWYVQ